MSDNESHSGPSVHCSSCLEIRQMPLLAPDAQGVVQSAPHGAQKSLFVSLSADGSHLQWMLIASNIGMLIWGGGWSCEWISASMLWHSTVSIDILLRRSETRVIWLTRLDVKHDLGWMVAPQYGAMPIPPQLWKKRYRDLNQPLTFWVNCTSRHRGKWVVS